MLQLKPDALAKQLEFSQPGGESSPALANEALKMMFPDKKTTGLLLDLCL